MSPGIARPAPKAPPPNSTNARFKKPAGATLESRTEKGRPKASSRTARARTRSTDLGRPDHDPQVREGPGQTRRGRAPIADHVGEDAGQNRQGTEENKTLGDPVRATRGGRACGRRRGTSR